MIKHIRDTAFNTEKLRIGLLVDSAFISKYDFELVQWAQSQPGLTVSHLVVQNRPGPQTATIGKAISYLAKYGFFSVTSRMLFKLIIKIESILLLKSLRYRDHLKKFAANHLVPNSLSITPLVSKSGFVYRYSADDIHKVKALQLDLLIRCGAGILRGGILGSCRFGILSFHHADNNVNRGGPAAFWEVYFRQNSTGFVIQQLTEELDGGNVLIRGRFPTKFFFLLNEAFLYTKSYFYLRKLLLDIARSRTLPTILDSVPYFNPLFRSPSLLEQLNYLSKLGGLLAVRFIRRYLLGQEKRWGVAYAKGDWKKLVMWRSKRITNPPNHFLADPFVINEKGGDYCFVEDYNYSLARACISVYKIDGHGAERIGEVIVEPFHMSFPYLFRFNSKIYMCPETSHNNDIRVYECVNFPMEWKLSTILMSGVSAVDTMLFERNGIWWLLTNFDNVDTDDHSSELYAFYADTPLSEKWNAHPKNPIYIDATRARNGGILIDETCIFRVSQKQGFDTYGKGFGINRIDVIDKDQFAETEVCAVEPNFFRGLIGSHHLHSNGSVCVFDYVEVARTRR